MANGRNSRRNVDTGRDAGGFVAMPWTVMDSDAYRALSVHAQVLLFEVARQFVKDNNGSLLLSRAYMATRGWKSSDMLMKAKRELLEHGFIFETVKGQRPAKASWYAVTWRALDRNPKYDAGAVEGFVRGAYRNRPHALAPANEAQAKNTTLRPPHGTGPPEIVPPHGTESTATVPPHGPIGPLLRGPPVPPHGHLLDMPSAARESAAATT